MKNRFRWGIVVGLLAGFIIATTTFAVASQQIKLIINGQEIQCDVPPQNINGRVLVPVRVITENLNCNVEWDGVNNAVIITDIKNNITKNDNKIDLNIINDKGFNTHVTKNEIELVNNFHDIFSIKYNNDIYFESNSYSLFTKNSCNRNKDKNDNLLSITINYYDGSKTTIPNTVDNIIIYKGIAHINSKYYK